MVLFEIRGNFLARQPRVSEAAIQAILEVDHSSTNFSVHDIVKTGWWKSHVAS